MIKRLYLAITFLSCCFFTGFAQVPSLWIRYFTREDGLTSSAITNVTQDSTGFIWIATRDGLYKYDGYAFTGYFTQPEDSTSLPSSHINYLYIDSKSKLWVATAFGICYYNKDLDNFERIADSKNYAGLTGINITQIDEDLNGNILIAHIQGIYSYDLHERLFKEVVSVEKGQINHFLIDNVNRIWIGCSDNQGLIRFNPNTRESKVFLSLETEKGEFSTATVNRLALENNRLWIALNGEGICMLNTVNGKLTRYPYLNNDDAVAINVYIDHSERVWTVDYAGLKILDNLTDSLTPYLPVKDDPHSVKVNVKGIFQDRQGNYWIYHEPGGVGIRTAPKGFNQLYNTAGYNRTASDANVSSIHEDARDHIWLGYYGGGIDVIDLQEGDTIHLRHNPKDKYSLGRGTILCIFRDSKGTMWIGTYFGGLQYYDEESGKFVSYVNNPKDPNSIAGADIRSIAEDREGNLWIAVHAKGVDKFDRKHKRFTHYNNAQNNLSNNWPFKLLVDSKGDLWAATAWGLNHLKNGENNFTSYLFSHEDTNSLSNNMVVDLYEDSQQVLWVGTSSGLNRYNRDKDNFIRYVNLFANNYLSGILGDADGNLWISNLSGLAMINSKNGTVKNFGVIDGLISEEFNPRSCYRNKFNEFFFGGTKGVDIFNPNQLKFNTTPPVVIIDKFRIFNKELTTTSSAKLKKHISQTDKITLKHTDKVIAINFKALNFINSKMNQYAYKLEGFEENWNYIGTVKEASYTNLNPGKYTFKVIASNNDGVWNTKGAELKIEILPPWYGTLAFKIFAALLVIGLIIGFIALRTSSLHKQKTLLEKTVQQKTSELYEKNNLLKIHTENLNEVNQLLIEGQDQLKKQSEELKKQTENLAVANLELQKLNSTKDKLFSVIAHDLTSPFNTIIGFSDLLVSHFDSISEDEKLTYARAIQTSSERVFTLLQNLLLWARSQTSRIICYPREIQVAAIIEETIGLSAEKLKDKEINVKVECPQNVKVTADSDMLKTIFRNLFSNAIKYTQHKGIISFSVIPENGEVKISVTDTGIGMKQDKIDELLSVKIVKPEIGTEGEKGSGLGLILCKDFIKANKGKLSIYSEEGKGSTFTFSLPQVVA